MLCLSGRLVKAPASAGDAQRGGAGDAGLPQIFAGGDLVALQAQEVTSATIVWPNGTKRTVSLRKGEVCTMGEDGW